MRMFDNNKLKGLRLKKEMSSRHFAFELYKYREKALTSQTIDKWEKGLTVPNFNNALLIADYFGLKLDDFVKDDKKQ